MSQNNFPFSKHIHKQLKNTLKPDSIGDSDSSAASSGGKWELT